jgi:hypothetical protein
MITEAVLIRRGDAFVFNPLEDLDDDELAPPIWSGPHVGKRMTEAMQTLRMLPMAGMADYRSSWPPYAYSFDDLIGQQEQGELEKTQRMQNRVRVLPSLSDISRMEVAICWPAQYLADRPHLMIAVNAVALAHAMERDAGWVTNQRGGYADTWRRNHDQGCDLIAWQLRNRLVPVF